MNAEPGLKSSDGQLAYLEAMRERHGDVFPVRLFGESQLLVVGDPELAEDVFRAPPDVLRAGGANRRVLGWLLGEGSLILLDGEHHLRHRRLLSSRLHGPVLESQEAAMRLLVGQWLDALPEGSECAILPLLRRLTVEVILQTAFGLPTGERRDALRELLLSLLAASPARDGVAARKAAAARTAVQKEVARRRAESARGREDILSALVETAVTAGDPLTDEEIRDELMTMVVAGAETTADSLAWALERLARAPEALARASAEAPADDGPYLEAVIRETLRMRPAVPMSARLARRPFELGDRQVEAGTFIAVSALLIHHRSDLYANPLAFRPERFLDKRPAPYAWIPFGGGIRRCVGAGFAMLEMRIALAALLARMTPRAPDPEPEGLRMRGNTLVPTRGARLVLEPRSALGAGAGGGS
jgi:cytochrome P450